MPTSACLFRLAPKKNALEIRDWWMVVPQINISIPMFIKPENFVKEHLKYFYIYKIQKRRRAIHHNIICGMDQSYLLEKKQKAFPFLFYILLAHFAFTSLHSTSYRN